MMSGQDWNCMKGKKAILVVSFGSSCPAILDKTTGAIERHIAGRFPEYRIYRAFTGRAVLRRLNREEKLHICDVREAAGQMAAEGMEDVTVQPTYVTNGPENERMLECIQECKSRFRRICVGNPLLSSAADYEKAVCAVMAEIQTGEREAVLLIGHGSTPSVNRAYQELEHTARCLGFHGALADVVKGHADPQRVMSELERSGYGRVLLQPFLIAAGWHVEKDLAGAQDSWMAKLEEAGYEVRVNRRGLGEMEGIRELFAEHVGAVIACDRRIRISGD